MPTQQEEIKKFIETICSVRKGLMDDNQFKATVEHNLSLAIAQREKEIFRKIKDYDFKENHLCGFNDGEQDCKCFIAGLNVALSIITKPNDKQNN